MGRTLPFLLDEACDRTPNAQAFNQWIDASWQPLSNQDFRTAAELVALGLLELGLESGDRIALLMHSDISFCIADMGSLLANLVDVPIDLTQTLEHIVFVLQHSEAKALMISNLNLLTQIVPYLQDVPELKHIIVADSPAPLHSPCPDVSPVQVPPFIQLVSLDEVRLKGQAQISETRRQQLRVAVTPDRLATIIYIPDETGQPVGVMLTHENLSANALTSFSGIPNLGRGNQEVVLSFLPLNHVLARVMVYGHINYGHSIYFSNPNRITKHFKEVQPTVLTTVPLLLEKIYAKALEKGARGQGDRRVRGQGEKGTRGQGEVNPFPHSKFKIQNSKLKTQNPPFLLSPLPHLRFSMLFTLLLQFLQSLAQWFRVSFTHLVFNLSLQLAKRYPIGRSPHLFYTLLLKLADRWVLARLRAVFGGRLKYVICGGAALKTELAQVFTAAEVPILHGYGLTQASAVVSCNRGSFKRTGTVGVPIAGMEVAIADDGEILLRGPYITQGYFKNPTATQAAINPQGWFHTGDLGEFTDAGFLKITGLKKALFKLSTGKYIVPQAIENRLKQSDLVQQAIVVGSERKFCVLLLIPHLEALHHHAQQIGMDAADQELLKHPYVLALYQSLVNAANCHLPYWATVKRFQLLIADLTIENGLLKPSGQIDRAKVNTVFATHIDALYRDVETQKERDAEKESPLLDYPPFPESSCPTFAQSLVIGQ
ncbi:AMP-binding protein [Kovacikia minuta CCNUW1]|uniref:AMP-dependent synthetase/ligase n=1 Tax=Kovacikia minuta TaxID=2931930 RepID=UPI001CCCAC2F|nr:AMP-binding protein [Kovacikia minuta]UBF27193.1 AMP-binding protein [Kovacikia minuta CCNUW1]